MRRAGYQLNEINAMRDILRIISFSGLNVPNTLAKIKEEVEPCEPVKEFIEFCENSKRGALIGGASERRG
jgi:acyl-[acyl carrier protein]--UDP-N-acetylglucosamine O-acyltransferase